MKVKLQLCFFMLVIHASFAVCRKHKTVIKGRALHLRCPIKPQAERDHVEWRNPDGVKDGRYSLVNLTESVFEIKIANVTFSDGGIYACSHYLTHVKVKTVKVTVLGLPKIEVTTHKGMAVIKCTAEANYPPPAISWQIDNGNEFHYHADIITDDKTYAASEMLHLKPAKKVTDVKCLVNHPALHSKSLMDFVKIPPKKNTQRPRPTILPEITAALKTTRQLTTDLFSTAETGTTTAQFNTSDANDSVTTNILVTSSQSNTTGTNEPVTTDILWSTLQSNTTDGPTKLPDPATQNQTRRIWKTTGLAPVSVTANISFNETKKNSSENGYDADRWKGDDRNASLLIFLVTCLILGLLVVVIFIGIKLRRAHIIWKRENDDSDTSETSSKSKASQEDKNAQKRRGFFNTGSTHYVIQESATITSVTNPNAMTPPEETAKSEQNQPTPLPSQTTANSKIKETEL